MFSIFKPPPNAPPIHGSPEEIRSIYRGWRARQLGLTFLAYAVYYFVRKNFSVAMPLVEKELDISKASLGGFLTAHGILYGVSKFLNGYLADRSNARTFLGLGLIASAMLNFGFGFSNTVLAMGVFWCVNGWAQGMGFPPCARVLSHWFSPPERGTMWSLWNASHMVGAAIILVWAGWLGKHYGWRWAFFGPAIVAVLVALVILFFLADTPGSVGLGPVENYFPEHPGHDDNPEEETEEEETDQEEFKQFRRRRVFGNPYIWLICIANFFVYTVRYGFLDWAPTYLSENKGYDLMAAGGMTAGFEMAGLFGSIAAGVLTDKFFRTHRAPVCVAYMLGTCVAIVCFWKMPGGSGLQDNILLQSVGFLIYGPQFLVGVMTADIVSKRAAATAIGLTGLFGYLSTALSGYGLGKILDLYGWDGGFMMLTAASALSALFFAFCWNAGPPEGEEE